MLLTPRPKATRTTVARPKTVRVAIALLATAASAALLAASVPQPAAPLGIGDRLFPHLGNPGYDVLEYDIAFTYGGDNAKPLDTVTKIDARATAPLERINLDFSQGKVRSVDVNGAPATFDTSGEDLVVTPHARVERGQRMRVTVRHTSHPVGGKEEGGWVRTADGLAMANQADAAHRVFPCNDHPADKARFTFRVSAPKALTAVANGVPLATTRAGATTTWAYRTEHPMATELAQVSIGRSTVLHRTGPRGLPVRDVVPTKGHKKLERWLKKTPGQVAWMEGKVGRYPFENYGLLVADAQTGFALETQTLSLFEKQLFTRPEFPEWYVDTIMVHELAHQWFGDSVSPRTWSDLWLNEGHATWYEALYGEEKSGHKLRTRMREAYRYSDQWRAAGGPPAAPKAPKPGEKISLFRPVVYDGSALVLYALRQEIGRAAFESVERAWVRAHRDGTATTADFTHLASHVSGRDLREFFATWLYGTKTPPMPGHPDWTSEAPGKKQAGRAGGGPDVAGHTHH
ncbi:M1 family metallopeptidase [Streptomyces sp. AN091965]|uniref:M1 family metallopeptidase n=1 Tax=Streptomyces sp. AN091965 TaxID=2927803 RepID=UPI001F61D8F7|nr:M1 family metallopeptidase [Streptomyces sp. AN091965]MCI3933485.1 M1 family metallopeptidase [Streptomyces sp. AN091965]